MTDVLVISGNNCPECTTLKNKLKSKNIEYKELNIVKNPEALKILSSYGLRSVPQLFVDEHLVEDKDKYFANIT